MKNFIKKLKTIWWRIKSFVAMYYYGNPSKKLKIIGVTGTNGKTTTATLLYRIATALGYKAGLISTVENMILGEKREATHTTPDSISLTKLLKEMLDKGCKYVFMEVSSHSLDQGRVKGVNFSGGIFTNLTHDHLDYHKSLENYFKAKKKFFKMLPENAFALSNMDDEHGQVMLENIKAKKYFYGYDPHVRHVGDTHMSDMWPDINFSGKILKLDFNGLELDFNGEILKSKLLGKFNAYNLLAVWSVCKLLGFFAQDGSASGGDKLNKIIENINPPTGRFDHFLSPSGVLVIVDYAHTPDALLNVLSTIKEIKKEGGRIISVFGCGGDRDPLKRSKMGKIGASLSDIAIFTSDNPRNEDPEKIIGQMKDNLVHEETQKVVTIADRRLAISEAVKMAQKGDIILCAGKGHEDYQEIKGKKHHFNDKEEFKKILK